MKMNRAEVNAVNWSVLGWRRMFEAYDGYVIWIKQINIAVVLWVDSKKSSHTMYVSLTGDECIETPKCLKH